MCAKDSDEDDYDSADSICSDIDEEEDDDVFADPLNNDPKVSQASAALKKHRKENTEHSNPYSLSWLIMRYAILKIAQNQLQEFISIAGIEMQGNIDIKPYSHHLFCYLLHKHPKMPLFLDEKSPQYYYLKNYTLNFGRRRSTCILN